MSNSLERFIIANKALMECYAAVPVDDFKAMNPTDQKFLCGSERESVRLMISNDEVGFRNLLSERLEIIKDRQHPSYRHSSADWSNVDQVRKNKFHFLFMLLFLGEKVVGRAGRGCDRHRAPRRRGPDL